MPNWNEIVHNNAANVLNSAIRVLGNLTDAEDVSQDVFAEAFTKWQFDPSQQWAGILRRMSVCRSIDLLRTKKPTESLVTEVMDRESNNPLELAIGNELQHKIRDAISGLPDRESQVFCLMYFEQLSHREISDSLGITRAAVATALSKAKSKLEMVFRKVPTGESK